MVPLILFFSVAAVGVLSLVAIGLVAKKQLLVWLRARARIAAQTARIAETARLKREHAEVLLKLQPPQPPAAPAPARAPAVGLTQVIRTLEHSALFTPIPPAQLEAPSPRSRMAKGSIPMPMTNRTPAAAIAAQPPRRAAASLPPPIPRRPSASVPPPIPARRPPPRRGH